MAYKILDERDIDLSYTPNSENAQSGKAVAEGLRTKADKNKILDYITYEIVEDENGNKSVTITGCNTSISGDYIIPNTIEGYIVTVIDGIVFTNCTSLTSITIPDSVTSIGGRAFDNCTSLISITIPNNVINIGFGVFCNCTSLESVIIGSSVITIGNAIFLGCTNLKNITIPDSITSIGSGMFENCTNLTSITIPDSVTSIGNSAFSGCRSLTSITIPDSVTNIYNSAFRNCSNLADVYYGGTQEQWEGMEIADDGNEPIQNTTIHYNQELATKEFVLNNGGSGSGTVDQTYNPESENAQSGKAVAEAINGVVTKDGATIDFNKPGVVRALLPQLVEADSIETLQTVILNPPENDIDGVNKKYVDDLITTKMNKFGEVDNYEGYSSVTSQNDNLVFNVNKKMQLNADEITLNSTSAKIDHYGGRLINIGSPIENTDAATKEYVDNIKIDVDQTIDSVRSSENIVGTSIGEKSAEFSALFKDTEKIDSFIFFSDPHTLGAESDYEEQFRQYIKTLKEYYNATPTSFVACGGDWLELHNRAEACFRLGYIDGITRNSFDRYYQIIGNHDHNSNTSGVSYPEEDDIGVLPVDTVRNLLLRDKKNTYYSFDGSNTKFYVLDSGAIWWAMYPNMWEQVEWLGNALKTNDNENSVIFVHAVYEGSDELTIQPFMQNVLDLCQAYNNGGTITLNNIEYDFTGCTGKMRFVLAGHKHKDYVGVVNGIPVVLIDDMRSGNTETFDLCLADYKNNILKMVRVGTGVNRNVGIYGNENVGLIVENIAESMVILLHTEHDGSGMKYGNYIVRMSVVKIANSGGCVLPTSSSSKNQPDKTYYSFRVPEGKSAVTVTCPEELMFCVEQLGDGGTGVGLSSGWQTNGYTYTFDLKNFRNWYIKFKKNNNGSFPTDYDTSGSGISFVYS